jgi:hypothetical protein
MSAGYFFTIQDPMLAPPEMLTTRANDSEWIRLCKVDQELLSCYGKKVKSSEHREKNYDRHTKKKLKVLDDIDIFLANKKSKHKTTICMDRTCSPPQMTQEWRELDYWDSSEAIKLLNPMPGVSVKQCPCDRGKLLQDVIEDANKLETIIEDWVTDNNATLLTAKQERRIVTQCLYLRKAYEIAVQRMNTWTWKECCAEAIKSLHDCGINYVGNEPTIRRLHMFFRKNETFPNPQGHSKKLLEPKVFGFFPELKSKIHDFCGSPDNQPSMSSESVAAKIRQNDNMTQQSISYLHQNIIAIWLLKVSNIAGVLRNEFTENYHSRTEGLGSPSRTVLFPVSARSTSQCVNAFQGRREATCLVIATKPWKRKTEEKKSRVLSGMKKYRRFTDPTGMHLPLMVISSHR